MNIHEKLQDLGLKLPEIVPPVANYRPFTMHNGTVYISGQLPMRNGVILHEGIVGNDVTLPQGQEAAQQCALNILAVLDLALDHDWSKLGGCLKLGGFIRSTPEYKDHSAVMDGASNLIADILGDDGKHARFAVGVPSLPRGACVEVDAIFSIK